MKILPEHYDHIKQTIKNSPVTIKEHRNNLLNSGAQPRNFDMRLRWDLFHYANLSKFACDTLYPYLTDDHIDTALKSIMKELEA